MGDTGNPALCIRANKDGPVSEGRMCGGGADACANICAICTALEEVPVYCFKGWGQLSRWSTTGHLALQAQRTNTNMRTTCAPRRWRVHSCDRYWSITFWQHSLTPSPYATYPSDCPNKAHSSPCTRRLQCNTRMFWPHDVRTSQEIKATSRPSSSLVAWPKRVNLKDTIISQAIYPTPYRVLDVRGRRLVWILYEEDTSILSCGANQYRPSFIPNESCTHLILPPKGSRILYPRPRCVCLKRRTCPTLNKSPSRNILHRSDTP